MGFILHRRATNRELYLYPNALLLLFPSVDESNLCCSLSIITKLDDTIVQNNLYVEIEDKLPCIGGNEFQIEHCCGLDIPKQIKTLLMITITKEQ